MYYSKDKVNDCLMLCSFPAYYCLSNINQSTFDNNHILFRIFRNDRNDK